MTSSPLTPQKPFLAYSIAFDLPGSGGCRQMARMLGASMARTFFSGDMVLVRNSAEPLFLVQREGVGEVYVEADEGNDAQALADMAMEWKALAATEVFGDQVGGYSWLLFLDVDCLALRNLDHLFDLDDEGETAILYQAERGRTMRDSVFSGYVDDLEMERIGGRDGINSGTWAVRADVYHEVMAEWLRIQRTEPIRPTKWREQCAWNRVILDAEKHGWKVRPFEAHEIQFPLHLDKDWKKYREAALLHCMGGTQQEKIEFMFGMYMQRFFHDPKGTLPGILDM